MSDEDQEEKLKDAKMEVEEEEYSEEEGSESGESEEEDGDDEEGDDDDEDEEEEEGEEEEDGEVDSENEASGSPDGEQSDSGSSGTDSEVELCPVCLCALRDQDIGSPESCDHSFCLTCILEWARNMNTCPVDRQVFSLILAKHSLEGTVYKRIPVEDRRLSDEGVGGLDQTVCEVCGSGEREDRLLLCDSCDLGYHLDCMEPPMLRVPHGQWFCPTCAPETAARRLAQAGETGYESDASDGSAIGVVRTSLLDRVLAAVGRPRHRIYDSESDWEPEPSTGTGPVATTSAGRTSTPKKRKTVKRKTKRKTKRRTVKKKTTTKTQKKRVTKSSTTQKKTKKKKVPTATLR